MFRQCVQQVKVVKRAAVGPGSNGAFAQRKARVGHHEIRREVHPRPQTVAFGTGAIGVVERKYAGGKRRHADAAVRTGIFFGIQGLSAVSGGNPDQPVAFMDGNLQRVPQPLADAVLHHQAVNDQIDVVAFGFGKNKVKGQVADFAVNANPRKAFFLELLQFFGKLAFFAPDQRG